MLKFEIKRKSLRALAATGLAVALGQSTLPSSAPAAETRPKLLKPNLVVLKAGDLSIQHTSTGRRLRFESALGNTGRGPIEVRPNKSRPCPSGKHHATQVVYRDVDGSRRFQRSVDAKIARRSAGCMLFHPRHDHWHFEAASRYTLYQPGQDKNLVRVARRKMSFCLRDSRRIPASYGTFRHEKFYGACSRRSPQGISVGWVDVYQSFLPGQALRLPRNARDGIYCLRIKVDPRGMLLESDDGDNTSLRSFRLTGDSIRFRRTSRCT